MKTVSSPKISFPVDDIRRSLERRLGHPRRERSEIDRRETIAELKATLNCSRPMLAAIEATADEIARGVSHEAVDVLEACKTLAMYGADAPEIIGSIEAVVDLATTVGEAPAAVAEYAGEAKSAYGESYTYVCNSARRDLIDDPQSLDDLYRDVTTDN